MQFNSEQLKAIMHGDGPALVIAGPGSGKTAVLTNRIKYLIEERHIEPEEILVITFSKSAATEMQNRFLNICGDNYYPASFGTFHSIFFQIIHSVYNYNTSNIINLRQKRELMSFAIKSSGILANPEKELIDCLLADVSFYKNNNESLTINSSSNISFDNFKQIYREYRQAMISHKKIDFEDMLLIVRNLFAAKKEILREYQEKYKYILIDEYQDINSIQYEIIKMLAGTRANLWICGDDDQSIYKFRGSKPEYMLGFKRDYPNALVYRLNINYRCAEEIISKAGQLISQNKKRFDKQIVGTGLRGEVAILACDNSLMEYEKIEALIKANAELNIALLTRTNAEASRYADILRGRGIKCHMTEKAFNPYDSLAYRIIYNYIKLAGEDPASMDIKYLLPVLNKPVRYISRSSIMGKRCGFKELLEANKDKRNSFFIIKNFEYHMKKLKGLSDLYSQINYIRKAIGIEEYLKNENSDGGKYELSIQILDWIQDNSRNFRTIDELNEYALSYQELMDGSDNYMWEKKEPDQYNKEINIMTYHASKGLEFDMVILPHVNEGSVPHKKAVGEELEEERRLFYVAMTRAKGKLYITCLQGKGRESYMPSRFLYSLK